MRLSATPTADIDHDDQTLYGSTPPAPCVRVEEPRPTADGVAPAGLDRRQAAGPPWHSRRLRLAERTLLLGHALGCRIRRRRHERSRQWGSRCAAPARGWRPARASEDPSSRSMPGQVSIAESTQSAGGNRPLSPGHGSIVRAVCEGMHGVWRDEGRDRCLNAMTRESPSRSILTH